MMIHQIEDKYNHSHTWQSAYTPQNNRNVVDKPAWCGKEPHVRSGPACALDVGALQAWRPVEEDLPGDDPRREAAAPTKIQDVANFLHQVPSTANTHKHY